MRPLPHFLLHIVVLVEDRLLVGRLNRNAFLEGRIFQFIVVPLRTADLVLNSSGELSLNFISCHGDNRVGFEAEPYGVHFLFSCLFFLEWWFHSNYNLLLQLYSHTFIRLIVSIYRGFEIIEISRLFHCNLKRLICSKGIDNVIIFRKRGCHPMSTSPRSVAYSASWPRSGSASLCLSGCSCYQILQSQSKCSWPAPSRSSCGVSQRRWLISRQTPLLLDSDTVVRRAHRFPWPSLSPQNALCAELQLKHRNFV